MVRGVAAVIAVALVALALAGLLVWRHLVVATATATIGGGPHVLVQNTSVVADAVQGLTTPRQLVLTNPSTPGTTLLAIFYGDGSFAPGAPSVVSELSGRWSRLASGLLATTTVIEVWAYPNNPGGI